jgi:hypothetical protein
MTEKTKEHMIPQLILFHYDMKLLANFVLGYRSMLALELGAIRFDLVCEQNDARILTNFSMTVGINSMRKRPSIHK